MRNIREEVQFVERGNTTTIVDVTFEDRVVGEAPHERKPHPRAAVLARKARVELGERPEETPHLLRRDAGGGHHGVSLVDAVGASCAVPGVWPPVCLRASSSRTSSPTGSSG